MVLCYKTFLGHDLCSDIHTFEVSQWFVGMLASLYVIYTTTVTTAAMPCSGTKCETTLFVNIIKSNITKVMNQVKCCNTVP